MKDELLEEFLRLSKSSIKAMEFKDKTVARVNKDMLIEARELLKENNKVYTLGVKNTEQIERSHIKKLTESKRYLWHTIDGMSDGGRAIDINIINPITGRNMTGSSSCSAVNVLYGINDIGIGTDGGGSVLAPALSLNLYSIMAKGLGLKGLSNRISTDGISFVPGIGVISHSLDLAEAAVVKMSGLMQDNNYEALKVAICTKENIKLPDGSDMREKLNLVYNRLIDFGVEIVEEEFPNFNSREEAINRTQELFKKYEILITYEGPVDLLGFGDSVFGGFGKLAAESQQSSGKYMAKIANMVNATAITIPSSDISSGIVVTAREGIREGIGAISLAKKLSNLYKLPDLYYRYFRDSYKRKESDIIFSVKGV
ncbi:amidase family protein [Clostridium swellfunianum]|uniref:amidase family protein n=1 Tax=Clostridium swellfunianum TaxID=1367462 RepID=UPI00202DE062|nr:amidase family protein [Clostridium swellfunianum]MCM0649737.1 amidase family protein [Clostridium swellfunianum]